MPRFRLGHLSIISLDRSKLQPVAEGFQAEEPRAMGNRLSWQNRYSRLSQSAPVRFQVLHHESDVPLIGLAWPSGVRQEVQFQLALSGGEPDEMEMRQA